MPKDLSCGILLDFYGFSLTEKQVEILNLYYNDDLSLGEIAETFGFTRQAALDFIRRGTNKLKKLESELKLYERFSIVTDALEKSKPYVEKAGDKVLLEEIDKALKMIEEN